LGVRCEECGTVAEGEARGWEAYRVDDVPAFADDHRVYFFCPACAGREFGQQPEDDQP
jgi:hypothetical protein